MGQLIGAPGHGSPARSVQLSGVYDPDQPSDGLTLDTPAGPVDLIAVDRARRGWPTPLTIADRAYLLASLPAYNRPAAELAARGMCVQPDAVLRAMTRRNARARMGAAA
ncbi:MAG TPA: hypothetical protein VL738_40170 [Dactylosporangium sp.]|jgi:hypothetical protein|nr:hypothetical protein [Dactylosporangium sp.]